MVNGEISENFNGFAPVQPNAQSNIHDGFDYVDLTDQLSNGTPQPYVVGFEQDEVCEEIIFFFFKFPIR